METKTLASVFQQHLSDVWLGVLPASAGGAGVACSPGSSAVCRVITGGHVTCGADSSFYGVGWILAEVESRPKSNLFLVCTNNGGV